MNKLLFLITLLLCWLSIDAQVKVVQDGTIEGPYPMGKDNYPTIEGKVVKAVSKVFISTSGIEINRFESNINGLILKTEKVIGGYDLWMNHTISKNSKLTIITSNAGTITIPLCEKKNRLKSDKKYIINLRVEGKDINEGLAYLILKSSTNTKVDVKRLNYSKTHDIKGSVSNMIKLAYGRYKIIDRTGKVYEVTLVNKPIIVEI